MVYGRIEVVQGDITKVNVDAIVNAADTSLMGGGGVDGAIHRAGGPQIMEECRKIVARQGGCKVGEAVVTTSGQLSAKYVIHTVGPVWNGGKNNEEEKLRNCYINSLRLAVENQCRTVAFHNISTGIYRFPKNKAACISVEATLQFLLHHATIDKVLFVCFDAENYSIVKDELIRQSI